MKIKSYSKETKAYWGMTLTMLIIGLSFVFVKISLRYADSSDVLAHRFTSAAVVMIAIHLASGKKFPRIRKARLPQLMLLSVFYPLLFFGLQTLGLQYTTASEAGILSAIMPVVTLIMASVVLKERSSCGQIVGILTSIAGVIYIFYNNGITTQTDSFKGNLLIIACVLAIVTYYILGRRINKEFDARDITFFMILTACVIFNATALLLHAAEGNMSAYFEPLVHKEFIFSILYLGVLSSLVTSFFNNYALSVMSASQVAVFNNLSPVITIAGGSVILGEQLHAYHIIGAVLVIAGVTATMVFKKKQSD